MNKQEVLQYIEEHVVDVWNRQERVPFTAEDWNDCFLHEFSEAEKKANEDAFAEFLKKTRKNQIDFEGFIEKESFLCVKEYMGLPLFHEYLKSMCMFFVKTKEFDPSITVAQVWQALRNYLIYGMVVAMVGEEQSFHDAIMAFSLLYPYTDNYIDDPAVSEEAKDIFNLMIQKTLQGEEAAALDELQEKTKQCLHMCRNYREGSMVQEASELCLLMLDAQAESTTYMGMTDTDYQQKRDEILHMLAYKGGVSVLIDYFYSVPKMQEKGIIFYLQFGLILQLADDIQDVREDRASKTPTMYSMVGSVEEREANLYQLMRFTKEVFELYDAENEQIRRFMLRNCMILYMFAILRSDEYFSDECIRSFEPYLPFRREFVKKIGKDIQFSDDMPKVEQDRLFKVIGEMCKQTLQP